MVAEYRRYLASERALTAQVAWQVRPAGARVPGRLRAARRSRARRAAGVLGDRLRGGPVPWLPSRLSQVPGHRPAVGAAVLVPGRPHPPPARLRRADGGPLGSGQPAQGAEPADRGGAAGQLRHGHAGRPPRPGDPGLAGPAGPACGRGGRPGAGRPGLGSRADLGARQGQPPGAAAAARRRRGGLGRLPARRPPACPVPQGVPAAQRPDRGPDRPGGDCGGLPGLRRGRGCLRREPTGCATARPARCWPAAGR